MECENLKMIECDLKCEMINKGVIKDGKCKG